MNKLLLLMSAVLLLCSCNTYSSEALMRELQQSESATYHNERFGFNMSYPNFLIPCDPPENGDGLSFRWGELDLTVYGSLNIPDLKEYSVDSDKEQTIDRGGYCVYEKVKYDKNYIFTLSIKYPYKYADIIDKLIQKCYFSSFSLI